MEKAVSGNIYIANLQAQRNAALNENAMLAARNADLEAKVAELEKEIAELKEKKG